MQAQQEFGFKELVTQMVGNMTKAVCERNGETKEQQFMRTRVAAHMVMGFMPRDVIEVMLAGHVVMFHEVIVQDVHQTLRGGEEQARRAAYAGIIAMDKAFGENLTRLEHYRARPSEGHRESPPVRADQPRAGAPAPAQAQARAPMADVVPAGAPEPAGQPPRQPNAPEIVDMEGLKASLREETAEPGVTAVIAPTMDMIEECRANQAAMAALDAGDPVQFARALGVEPSEAYIEAAKIEMADLNRDAARTRAAASPGQAPNDGDAGAAPAGESPDATVR